MTIATSGDYPAELGCFRAPPESPDKFGLEQMIRFRSYSPRQSAIEKTVNSSWLNPYNFLLVLRIARIFIAYDSISIKWDLIAFLCNRGNTIDLLKVYLNLKKSCFDIFCNVIVYDMFKNSFYRNVNLSYCIFTILKRTYCSNKS